MPVVLDSESDSNEPTAPKQKVAKAVVRRRVAVDTESSSSTPKAAKAAKAASASTDVGQAPLVSTYKNVFNQNCFTYKNVFNQNCCNDPSTPISKMSSIRFVSITSLF